MRGESVQLRGSLLWPRLLNALKSDFGRLDGTQSKKSRYILCPISRELC